MSITVADCLQLPALREATAIGGHKGLSQSVSSVSVLEYAHISALAEELFLGNELILSAFTSVMDSVEEQISAIHRLHEVGEVGLVLYYVGYFLPRVDPRLINAADELDFPLIVMPPNTYRHRYSEVITEVLEAIFEDRKKETRFVPQLMESISRLSERQQTLSSVLRLLSDRLRCGLLLLGGNKQECGFASWPMAATEEFTTAFRAAANALLERKGVLSFQGDEYYLRAEGFHTDTQTNYRLIALTNRAPMREDDFVQAVDVLQMFCNIWKEATRRETADNLVRAILNDQQPAIRRITERLRIDLKKIRVMWVLRQKTAVNRADDKSPDLSNVSVEMVRAFLREHGKMALVDAFDKSVVAFMDDAKFLELDKGLTQSFMEYCRKEAPEYSLIWCGGLDSIQDVRLSYMLIEEYFSTACAIYPNRDMFTVRELTFAKECRRITGQGEELLQDSLAVLRPLQGLKDEDLLLKSLAVYLIDADMNAVEAGAILHVHEGTVKYRINKIQRQLGYDLTRMPGSYELYLALAIWRLQQ